MTSALSTNDPSAGVSGGGWKGLGGLIPTQTKIWQKLFLIAFTLVLPVAVLSFLLIQVNSEQIDFATKEVNGVDFMQPLGRLAGQLVSYRGLLNAAQIGDPNFKKKDLDDRRAEIEKSLKAVDAMQFRYDKTLRTDKKWPELRTKITDFLGKETTDPKLLASFDDVSSGLVALFADVGETSNLLFDPVLESYYLMDTMYYRIPGLVETLARIRDLSHTIVKQKKITPEEKEELLILIGQTRPFRDTIAGNQSAISRTNVELGKKLQTGVDDHLKAVEAYTDLIRKRVVAGAGVSLALTPQEVVEAGNRAISSSFHVFEEAEPNLRDLLQGRIYKYQTKTNLGLLSIMIGMLVTFLVVYLITRGVTRQVNAITDLLTEINQGNLQARADVTSTDELGQMTLMLNRNILPLVQSRGERDSIQRSITKLLTEVSGVAEGDLRHDAEVSADVTGTIADSFNYMMDQLRRIIGDVQDATLQVSSSANEIRAAAEDLVIGSEAQAEQIVHTSTELGQMSTSIQKVSETALQSASVAQQALTSAKDGGGSVRNTIQGMARIREQVQETAKRIKRLGESTQEVGQIIQLIDDIADRTSILALNASIQAAEAGEAGRGFAVVAEEVERLAVRSTDATKKIATLIKTIQTETGEAVTAMERGIQEVVEGSKLANQAGQALDEIESVSNRLAEMIGSISLASKQQAHGSESLANSMTAIAGVTQRTASGTKEAAEAVSTLAALADELRASVSTFRLPPRAGTSSMIKLPSVPNGRGKAADLAAGKSGVLKPGKLVKA